MNISITPDNGGQNPFRRKIVKVEPVPKFDNRKICTLECGHMIQSYGDLRHAAPDGVVCDQCKALAMANG